MQRTHKYSFPKIRGFKIRRSGWFSNSRNDVKRSKQDAPWKYSETFSTKRGGLIIWGTGHLKHLCARKMLKKNKEISISMCGGKEWKRLKQMRWCCWAVYVCVYVYEVKAGSPMRYGQGSDSVSFFWTGWCHCVYVVFIFLCFISHSPPVQVKAFSHGGHQVAVVIRGLQRWFCSFPLPIGQDCREERSKTAGLFS